MNRILSGVMGHYNAVAKMLRALRADYPPIYDVDSRTGDVYWQMWADGFVRAVNLRPDAWSELLQEGDDYSTALVVLMTLGALGDVNGPIEDEDAQEVIASAPDVIPEMVSSLND